MTTREGISSQVSATSVAEPKAYGPRLLGESQSVRDLRAAIEMIGSTFGHGAFRRRNRRRKRSCRPRDSRSQSAVRPPADPGRLHGFLQPTNRVAALRPCPRSVHRRDVGSAWVSSAVPTAARYFSTKSANCRFPFSPNCSAPFRSERSCPSAAPSRFPSTCE